jgi:hypothetical protein
MFFNVLKAKIKNTNFYKNYPIILLKKTTEKKRFSIFTIIDMWLCFKIKFRHSNVMDELRLYFILKRRYILRTFNYYRGYYDYYSERVYEDDSEYKFNEKMWLADLKQIKHDINLFLYKHLLDFVENPIKYFLTSFLFLSIKDNFIFWKNIIPALFKEIYIISCEVFFSFYTKHDEDKFYKIFSLEEARA